MKFFNQDFSRPAARRGGFTLVEILVSLTVVCFVLASIAVVAVTAARVMRKNVLASDAVTATRLFQEHLNREISTAVSDPGGDVAQQAQVSYTPQYRGGDGGTPERFSRLTYRVVMGPRAVSFTSVTLPFKVSSLLAS